MWERALKLHLDLHIFSLHYVSCDFRWLLAVPRRDPVSGMDVEVPHPSGQPYLHGGETGFVIQGPCK